jgi:hypothetical protein
MTEALFPDMQLIFDGHPFTAAEAETIGVDVRQLRRLRDRAQIRSIVRGVYVDALIEDSLPLRAAAVAKVAPDDAVICRQTAAWLYGVDTHAVNSNGQLPALEFVRPRWRCKQRSAFVNGHAQTLLPGDVIEWHGLAVTSPLATAVHLARHLARPFGLSALDAMARAALIRVPELIEAVDRYPGHPGIVQARELARLVSPAAESPAESWLRLRIIDAGFPVPVPQARVQEYRLDLGFRERLPWTGRRLGLEYDSDMWHGTWRQQLADEHRRRDLERLGWDVLSVGRGQIWGREPALELAVGDLLGIEPRLPRRW